MKQLTSIFLVTFFFTSHGTKHFGPRVGRVGYLDASRVRRYDKLLRVFISKMLTLHDYE